MSPRTRRRGVRIGIPVGATLAALAAAALTPSLTSAQTESLTPQTPQGLVAAVLGAKPQAFSGTLEATSNLLGSDASLLAGVQGSGGTTLVLPQGTATVRMWRAPGADLRLEVLDAQSERDLYASATGVWLWNSAGEQAVRATTPGGMPLLGAQAVQGFDPTTLADRIVAHLSASSSVAVGQNTYVAGQAAYTLVVTPAQAGSTIGSVRIFVDAANDQVLGVTVDDASGQVAFSWAFTQIAFGPQPRSVFDFSPPPGATVTTATLPPACVPQGLVVGWSGLPPCGALAPQVPVLGTGWDRVAVLPSRSTSSDTKAASETLQSALRALEQPVVLPSGERAMLVRTTLVNALVLPSGQTLVGAVSPSVLEADAPLVGQAG
jgi:hypothetical protein